MLIAGVCPQCEYQAFVHDVNDALQRVGSTESTILLRDFKAHIGTESETWKGVIGRHRDQGRRQPKMNGGDKHNRYLNA